MTCLIFSSYNTISLLFESTIFRSSLILFDTVFWISIGGSGTSKDVIMFNVKYLVKPSIDLLFNKVKLSDQSLVCSCSG